jgi:hypothetical protein
MGEALFTQLDQLAITFGDAFASFVVASYIVLLSLPLQDSFMVALVREYLDFCGLEATLPLT